TPTSPSPLPTTTARPRATTISLRRPIRLRLAARRGRGASHHKKMAPRERGANKFHHTNAAQGREGAPAREWRHTDSLVSVWKKGNANESHSRILGRAISPNRKGCQHPKHYSHPELCSTRR